MRTEQKEEVVSHGVDLDTGKMVTLPCVPPADVGAVFDPDIDKYVVHSLPERVIEEAGANVGSGRLYRVNYGRAEVLTVDDGVRPGCRLLAYYNTGNAPEAALLQVVEPSLCPGYMDMSEYFGADETRARAYACNVFGCFCRDGAGSTHFESYSVLST